MSARVQGPAQTSRRARAGSVFAVLVAGMLFPALVAAALGAPPVLIVAAVLVVSAWLALAVTR